MAIEKQPEVLALLAAVDQLQGGWTTNLTPARQQLVDAARRVHDQLGYQGWMNYQTWAVALWLGNEQGSEEWARETVMETLKQTGHISQAGDALKEGLEEQADQEVGTASMFHDLLTHALGSVDWIAVAEAFRDDEQHEAEEVARVDPDE